MTSLREEKNLLRDKYRSLSLELPTEKKQAMDQRICRLLEGTVSFRYAQTVLLYYPLLGEVDIRPLLADSIALGKQVGLPVTREGGEMDFRLITDLQKDLLPGRFGILEPREGCPLFQKEEEGTILVVPALSFDRDGFRLGYGKGYYDRYMTDFSVLSVGLCYESFVEKRLPRGKYDRSVSLLVTEKGVKCLGK
jgi:5-formyltetrahydrofolate cyclo-ligase